VACEDIVFIVNGFVRHASVSNVIGELQIVGLDDAFLNQLQWSRPDRNLLTQSMGQLRFL